MRYRLRTLLIVLAIGPPLLAGVWFAFGQSGFWPKLLVTIAAMGIGFVVLLAAAFAVFAAVVWVTTKAEERGIRLLDRDPPPK